MKIVRSQEEIEWDNKQGKTDECRCGRGKKPISTHCSHSCYRNELMERQS